MAQILAFSGHRFPNTEKLGESEMLGFLSFLKQELYKFFSDRTDKYKLTNIAGFVCGGALGFDMAAQQFALENNIPLVIAVPYSFDNFLRGWSPHLKTIFSKHFDYAEKIIQVDTEPYYKYKYSLQEGSYHVSKLQWRNQYMIDNSDATVFYLNPSSTKGGTYNAFQYCQKVNKPYFNMWQPYIL